MSSDTAGVRRTETHTRFTAPTGTNEETTISFATFECTYEKCLELFERDGVRRRFAVFVHLVKNSGLWMM